MDSNDGARRYAKNLLKVGGLFIYATINERAPDLIFVADARHPA